MREFFRRLYYLLNRGRFDRELADDLEFHREMAARAGGMPLGNALHLREEARDAWGWTWTERARRIFATPPGCLAIARVHRGRGADSGDRDRGQRGGVRVFQPHGAAASAGARSGHTAALSAARAEGYASVLPYPEMVFFRENAKTLSAVLAFAPSRLTIEGEEKPIKAQFVTGNYFRELGAAARLGRTLEPGFDDAPAAEAVAVLSYGFWQRHFGGDPSVAGKVTRLNGKPVTVIGVAAAEFGGLSLEGPDAWLPIVQQPHIVDGSKLLTDFSVEGAGVTVWGRLRPGFAPKAAEDELRSLAAVLHGQRPDDIWENESLPSTPGAYATSTMSRSHNGTGGQEPDKLIPIAALAGALVLLILAVACGNLGSLLLARGVAREREIAIRIAVGAGKGRLVRQLFTESLLLGLLGALAGLGLGYVVLRWLMAASGGPEWLNPAPDWRVVMFAAAMGFGTAIVFGLTPAWQIARQRHRASMMRQVMIGAQVAASCVLLIIAGLLARALTHATADPGFAYQQIVTIDPALGNHGYSPAAARAYLDTLQSRVHELPGVESMASPRIRSLGTKPARSGRNFGDTRSPSTSTMSIRASFRP